MPLCRGRSALLTQCQSQSYLPGPVAAEEWSRFEYYAQFVRVLRYSTDETIDPSVFFFLQQHARGKPLFPNLHQLVWEHATPELVSVITPSIRVLHLPQDYAEMENGSQSYEYGYRMRRHAFKQLLRGVLERLPDLAELTLPVLGHEAFWFPLLSKPDNHFVTQGIHTLHRMKLSILQVKDR
ncbi:hypothetical protein EVJ58_g11199 [Rhodofomes roseus]|uniref:Uncharacterized protein n=1 Tax=Rhodofomes roseus TaxID=34475 RepID=A0A4Y9XNF5_9APHY|nr:hypothetical protein EVJ58_g11199 [Rhodofomes roseus]